MLYGEVVGLSAGTVRLKAEGKIVAGVWLFQISSRGTVCDSAVVTRFCVVVFSGSDRVDLVSTSLKFLGRDIATIIFS